MTYSAIEHTFYKPVSTHMPLARHDKIQSTCYRKKYVSTHMPLARHDDYSEDMLSYFRVSTHMPLARHDTILSGM